MFNRLFFLHILILICHAISNNQSQNDIDLSASNANPNDPISFKAPLFEYYGGPILSNVEIFSLFWGGNLVPDFEKINQFYIDIANSTALDWLEEYNTPSQKVGRASFRGFYLDDTAPIIGDLTQTQIESRIKELIRDKKLPPATSRIYYAVHFPKDVHIFDESGRWSSRHWAAKKSDEKTLHFAYGMIPNLEQPECYQCYWETESVLQNIYMFSYHELMEAITDPIVWEGWASYQEFSKGGEYMDVCISDIIHVTLNNRKYTVTSAWSNKRNKCFLTQAVPLIGERNWKSWPLNSSRDILPVTTTTTFLAVISTPIIVIKQQTLLPSPTGMPVGEEKESLSSGVAIGSTFGGVFCIIAGAGITFLVFKRREKVKSGNVLVGTSVEMPVSKEEFPEIPYNGGDNGMNSYNRYTRYPRLEK